MRYALGILAIVVLNSCNTSIGLYRDTAQAFNWTKQKMEESNNNSGGGGQVSDGGQSTEYDYGAPIY